MNNQILLHETERTAQIRVHNNPQRTTFYEKSGSPEAEPKSLEEFCFLTPDGFRYSVYAPSYMEACQKAREWLRAS